MQRILVLVVCAMMLAATFAVAMPMKGNAATIIVVPDDYATIQAAINAADPGDTVYVKSCSDVSSSSTWYDGNLTIDKSLTLQGQGRDTTFIDGQHMGTNVHITADDVVITGFTLYSSSTQCVWVDNAARAKIINCNVRHNNEYGIYMRNSPNAQVKDCDVFDTKSTADYKGRGIDMENCADSLIEDVRLFGNQGGDAAFCIYSSDNTLIRNVELFDNVGGIRAGFANYTMTNINIHDNGLGVVFNGASGGSLENSTIRATTGSGVHLIFDSTNNVIEGNLIESNACGIQIGSPGVTNNRFYHNYIIDNVLQVADQAPGQPGAEAQVWDNGYPSGGNYWSDYDGVDNFGGPNQDVSGGDGIGDTPYLVTAIAEDNYPLMNVVIACDADGIERKWFAPGEGVYVKASGLVPNADYRIWIQDDPVDEDEVLDIYEDLSGMQELVTTGADGSLPPIEIWAIPSDAAPTAHQFDIIVDRQNDGGNTGRYNSASDGIDSAFQVGFTAPIPELATITLLSFGMVGLGGFVWYRRRRAYTVTTS